MTVVLIGRESPVRERLIAALRELEGVVIVAQEPGADDIKATILSLNPDVVLIDIQQAQAGGLKLISAIKGLKNGRAPVIIALSSSASIQYRTKCHEAGATFFFDKANDQELLLSAVQSMREEIDYQAGRNDGKK